MTTRLIIAGATGQTGGKVFEAAIVEERIDVVGVVSSRSNPGLKIPVFSSLTDAPDADAVVDFTVPGVTVALAKAAAGRGLPFVTGTTGLDESQQAAIAEAAKSVPVVQSGNFSLGVNLLMSLVEKTAAALSGFDIEITETHHRRKVDAPSGTALMLGSAAARGRETTLSADGVFARHGEAGPRKDGEIGFSVIRGGGVPGDHQVAFMAEDEVITLGHRALNRDLFAQGALKAAQWVKDQKPGLYSMRDVLGLD